MPSLVKVFISKGRDLPIMDNSMQGDASTDAFVEIRLGEEIRRTNVCRKSLNPAWDESFHFEVIDDSSLQDAPLELRVIDQDLYSSELIGLVYIDLNPLIMRTIEDSDRNLSVKGWFPLFDTLKGIRGEIYVNVKLQFIGNDNPFQDSSAGVQFFSASSLSPKAFIIKDVLGFVVDLVVEDDPESSWQDYFRKSGQVGKSSNAVRQKVLYNLSAEVRRELGKKVLDMGGNAVLGFHIHFDLEGASGIVARAYGTACSLLRVNFQKQVTQGGENALHGEQGGEREKDRDRDRDAGGSPFTANNNNNYAASSDTRPEVESDSFNSNSNFFGSPSLSRINSASSVSSEGFVIVSGLESSMQLAQSTRQQLFLPDSHGQRDLSSLSLSRPDKDKPFGGISGIKNSGDTLLLVQPVLPASPRERASSQVSQLVPFGPQQKNKLTIGMNMNSMSLKNTNSKSSAVLMSPEITRSTELNNVSSGPMHLGFQQDVQLLSLQAFEPHVKVRLGGLVIARSVKFLGKLEATLTDQETREGWWEDLRDEIKSHARTLCCTHIVGYRETCTIFGDACVLSSEGTAAIVQKLPFPMLTPVDLWGPKDDGSADERDHDKNDKNDKNDNDKDKEKDKDIDKDKEHGGESGDEADKDGEGERNIGVKGEKEKDATDGNNDADDNSSDGGANMGGIQILESFRKKRKRQRPCTSIHVPYKRNLAPFSFMRLVPCLNCKRKWVCEYVVWLFVDSSVHSIVVILYYCLCIRKPWSSIIIS